MTFAPTTAPRLECSTRVAPRNFPRRIGLALALAAAALAGACHGGGGGGGSAPAVDPNASTVVVQPAGTRLANGTDAAPVVVTVLDTHGDPMAGLVVVIDATGQGNVIVQPVNPTDAAGQTTGFVASTHAEAKIVGAAVTTTAGIVPLAATDSVTFVGDPSTISATLSAATASPALGVVANAVDASTITVTVADAFGNPVPGQSVLLASSGSNHVLTQPAGPTDAAGTASGTITSTLAETKTITATINAGPSQVVVTQQPTVEFIGDASAIDGNLSSATANPALDVLADGVASSTITVTVRDVFGNPVAGRTVALASTGTQQVISQPAPTNASGTTTGTISSTHAETKTITATIEPGPSQVVVVQQPTVLFIADASTISALLSTASAVPNSGIAADGVTQSTITVQVVDAFGNPVPGQTVALAATGTGNTLVQPPSATDANGVAIGTLASTVAETKTVTATVNPGGSQVVLAQQPTVTFSANPGTISGGLSTITAFPTGGVIADGLDTAVVTVTVVDANGNPVPGQTVVLGATGSNNVLGQPASTTDAAGVATGTIASTTAETKTVSATVNPGANQVILAQQATVGFVGDPSTIDPATSTAVASPSSNVVADGTTTSTITVTVRDAHGNPVAGQTVQLAATGANNTLVQPAGTTGANGVLTGTIASTTAETKTITATIDPSGTPIVVAMQPTVAFVGDPSTIDPTLSSATANPASDVVADGTAISTITVTVRDAHGNPVAGRTVQLASTGTNNTLVQPAGTTDASGVATGTIASTMAETKTLTATIEPGPSQVVVAMQPTVAFVGDPSTIDPALSSATANPTSDVVADGTATSTITVTVRDAHGNPVAGRTVQLASTGTNNTLVQPAGTTDASGVATGTIASTMAETKTLTATIEPGPSQVVVAQQPTVAFVGDPSTIDPALSSATANPASDVVADGTATSTITVTVRDAHGNPVAGRTVQLASTGTNNTLVQPAGTTDASGVATGAIASTMAETKTLTATIEPGPSQVVVAMQPTVAFVGDPSTIDPALSSATANPTSNVLADGVATSTITVTVRDAHGNPVAGRTVQLASTGTNNTLVQPAATDAAGVATGTIASTTPETKTLTATIDPGPGQVIVAQQPTVGFIPVVPTVDPGLSTVLASPSLGLSSNGIDASTITVTVLDTTGAPMSGQTVQLSATGTGNTLTQPLATTDAFGVATGTLTSTTSETKTITATANPGPGQVVVLQQPTVTFAGDPSQISAANCAAVASPSTLVAADGVETSTITVTVRDVNGGAVAGQSVTLAATGSSNVLVQPAALTDAAGRTSGTLASSTAETKTVTATVNPGPGQVVVAQHPTVGFAWNPTNARYVRMTGTDPAGCTGGTTPATAWRTIGKAASCAPPGTTVYVGAGVYAESVSITQSGTAANPIRFLADPAGTFTGDAGSVGVDAGGLGRAFQLDGVSWVVVEGFEITGSGTSGGIHVGDGTCSNVVLRGNSVYGNPYGIYVHHAASATIEHNSISNNFGPGGDGVVVDDSDTVTVRDNLIYGNGQAGIAVRQGSLTAVVDANTLYANSGDQVTVDPNGNSVSLTNNVIVLGPQNGITLFVGSALTTSHNDVWGQGGSDWNGASASGSDLSLDPRFVDPDGADGLLGGAEGADDDFRLDFAFPSPVLDAGSGAASAVTTADGLSLADRTSRTDGVLDGSTPDGATLNLGYHYPVPGDAQPALAPGDVRITYGEGTMRQPRRRLYDEVGASWTAETSAPSTVDTIRWVAEKISPLSSGEEIVATLAGTPAGGRLDLLRWSGQAWSREVRSIAIAPGEVDKKGFDVEFEALSGDLMIVYSVNTTTPVYRTRTNAGWSAETPLPLNDGAGPNPDLNTGIVQWIEVEPRPGTNEIAVVYSDTNRDLMALVWNGSQWLTSTATVLATDLWTSDLSGVVKNRPFDIAYEGVTGGLMAAWSRSTSGGIWTARKGPATSTFTAQGKIPSVPNFQSNHIDLGAEPGTSRIAVCGMDIESATNAERLGLATWNGTAWVNGGQYDVAAANLPNTSDGDFPCAVGWLGTTGSAVCVYADSDNAKLDWARWISGSGWTVQSDVSIPGKTLTDSVQIASNALGHLMAVLSDSAGHLWAARYNGASWTVTNGGAELETGISSNASVPFDAVQKNP